MGRSYSYDSKCVLSDNAAAYTTSGIGQVASANAILKVGGTGDLRTDLSITGSNVSRLDAMCVVDITALTLTTDGEYGIFIMGSNGATGADPVILAGQVVGLGSTIPGGSGNTTATDIAGTGSTTTPGKREIPFTTEQNGVFYEYIFLYVNTYGTTSKSISLSAFYSVLMPD